MREGGWEECIEHHSALKITIDKARANSLIDTAKGRTNYFKSQVVNETSASFIFEGYYASVLELLHAIVILQGYKVDNHVCLGYYLRDVLKNPKLFRFFYDCRFKRNSLVYYGKKMDLLIAKNSIQKCKKLISELNSLLV